MKLKTLACTLLVSSTCLATDPTSTIVLTKPANDVRWTAGTKVQIKFQTEDITGPVEVRLVKSLGGGSVDMSVQYSMGLLDAKNFGLNKFLFRIRPDIPADDYGVFLFATDAMTGEPLHSVSSPTVHLVSSIFHPGVNAVVRKGKDYIVRWKGAAPEGVDSYTVYFQGNVTEEPFNLRVVSWDRNSARVTIPECPDTMGMFILKNDGLEIDGNVFNLK